MHVHNLMEEVVIDRINHLNDQIKEINPPWFRCDCENCRMDAVTYVLNRVPPKYVVSGRGVVYTNENIKEGQVLADIDAIGLEGIRIVNSVQRPNHVTSKVKKSHNNAPIFNFPIFTGDTFDGLTFEPLTGAEITLKSNGKLVEMQDSTWPNPCTTYQTTKGTYSFWLKSIPAEKEGETKVFNFTLEISAKGYESIHYSFSLPVTAELSENSTLDSTYSYKIQDLFLFANDIENPME
ncbi:MAG: late competence development ComFB family protein [Treponema sp.]|nr:late competence development ComFB family protein [Treponema sp.]